MSSNVGTLDRALRLLVGIVLIAFALFSQSPYALWGWIGVIPLATGLMGWCPAYRLLGIRTCRTRRA